MENLEFKNKSLLNKLTAYCLTNKFVVILILLALMLSGLLVAPFDWDIAGLPRNPVSVDAIPDIEAALFYAKTNTQEDSA